MECQLIEAQAARVFRKSLLRVHAAGKPLQLKTHIRDTEGDTACTSQICYATISKMQLFANNLNIKFFILAHWKNETREQENSQYFRLKCLNNRGV